MRNKDEHIYHVRMSTKNIAEEINVFKWNFKMRKKMEKNKAKKNDYFFFTERFCHHCDVKYP